MGFIEDFRDRYILAPLAKQILSEGAAQFEKAVDPTLIGGQVGQPVLRTPVTINQGPQSLSNRIKPQGQVGFDTLRSFSVQYDVARIAINRRKRQLTGLQWDIVPYEEGDKNKYESQIKEVKEIITHIGGYKVRFRELVEVMVEDLLVLDAMAVYKRPTMAGGLYSLDPIDGATIQLTLDGSGRTPEPPDIAYKQIIRGKVISELTADELMYEKMNSRSNSAYGLSPLESLILTVSSALKSELYNLNYLTDGNIPEGFFGVPKEWSTQQIKEFQAMWDAAMAGDPRATSRLRFVPDGAYTPTKKPTDMAFREFNEWLMIKTCAMFEIPPQELGFTQQINKANGQTQQEIGVDAGLRPLANFFNEIFTDLVRDDLGFPNLAFKFMIPEARDEKADAETDEIRIRSGQNTINEIRVKNGDETIKDPYADKIMIISGTPTFIDSEEMANKAAAAQALADAQANSTDQGAQQNNDKGNSTDDTSTAQKRHVDLVTELRAFRKYALTRLKDGKALRKFESSVLPDSATEEINRRLEKCASVDDAKAIFREYFQDYQINFLADVAEFKRSLTKVK